MPHNAQHSRKTAAATARFVRLRAEGVPRVLTPMQAWYLSGGVCGVKGGYAAATSADEALGVPLARIVRDVPDCETFLPDFREHFPA